MKTFQIERATVLPFSRETVFDFFSRAENLELPAGRAPVRPLWHLGYNRERWSEPPL